MKTTSYLLGIALIAATFTSCQKDDDATPDSTMVVQENESAEYAVEIDAIADEAYEAAQAAALKSVKVNSYLSDCATVTLTGAENTKTLTIDFGTECVGKDGRTRTGKIIVTTQSFTETNKLRTFSFDGYTVNGHAITGEITKNITNNIDTNSRLAEISEDITITLADNQGTLTRSAQLTRLYEFGTSSIVADNRFTTWGQTIFTNAMGRTITKTVAESTPLLYKTICRQVVSGIMTIDFGNDKNWTINFGDGSCDNLATASNDENSWVIRLRK
jgi:hypothetical protein